MKHIVVGNYITINHLMYEIVAISNTRVSLCFCESQTRQWKCVSVCTKQLADFLSKAA